MKLCGVCILTDDAPTLAAFYQTLFQETPDIDGDHYSFSAAQLSVYNPGGVDTAGAKNMSLMYFVPDLMSEYHRLQRELPNITITSPPTRRPWGAFSFWLLDPCGNTISLVENSDAHS